MENNNTTRNFTYTENAGIKNNVSKPKLTKLYKIFVLILLALLVLVIFFIFNRNILSLYTNPTQNQNHSVSDYNNQTYNVPGTNEYRAQGKIKSFDQNYISIGLDDGSTVKLKYDFKSRFYVYKNIVAEENASAISTNTISVLQFPENILKSENLNKKVSITFANDNHLEELTLLP